MRSKRQNIALLILLVAFCSSISIVFSYISLTQMIEENRKNTAIVYSGNISEMINATMAGPIAVSLGLNNPLVNEYVENASQYEDEELCIILRDLLDNLKNSFSYDTAFIALESNHFYITEHGYSRTIDENDLDDIWYSRFRESGLPYELNVDNDIANENRLTIYVNVRMEDAAGNFIGICGIGLTLNDFADEIASYQNENEYSILLANADGKIQVDGNKMEAGTFTSIDDQDNVASYIKDLMDGYKTEDNYMFCELEGSGFCVVKYIKQLDWYLVIEYEGDGNPWYSEILQRNIAAYVISFVTISAIMIVLVTIFYKRKAEFNATQEKQEKALRERIDVINSLANSFYCIYYIDTRDGSFVQIDSREDAVKQIIGDSGDAQEKMDAMAEHLVLPEFAESIHEFTTISTLRERLRFKTYISQEFIGVHSGWSEGVFIAGDRDEEGYCKHVIWAIRVINDIKEKEQALVLASNTDSLTGIYNRRMYENDMREFVKNGLSKDFVYVAMDVNGLKQTNDTLGHDAGDEIIIGAAALIKQCLGPYGSVYRIGGDEFTGMIHADETRLNQIIKDLEENCAQWHGNRVSTLSVSCGYATAAEFPNKSLEELSKIADERMYETKALYYQQKGIDRRTH